MKPVQSYYEALHQIPECSGQERETAAYVFEQLCSAGYSPRSYACGGVTADLTVDPGAPWIALRADMDALPVSEPEGLRFRSRHAGVMHACGHDAHMAMLLAAAAVLREARPPQNLRFLFQPAEETTEGAKLMLAEHALPPRTAAIFSIHVWPGVPLGRFTTRVGALMASSDVFRVRFQGTSVHCAQRSKGHDALQAAVAMAAGLPALEALAGGDGTVLFLGSLQGGQSHNIVPNQACLYGTLRTYCEAHRRTIRRELEILARTCAAQQGASAELLWEGGCPVVENSPLVVETLQRILPDLDMEAECSLAAEDFACYLNVCPGALLWLGTGETASLHSPQFRVPPEILSKGVDAWLHIAAHPWHLPESN